MANLKTITQRNSVHIEKTIKKAIIEIMEARKNVRIHPTAIVYPNVVLGDNVVIGPYCIIGEPSSKSYTVADYKPALTKIGDNSIIRSHTVIYEDVVIKNNFSSGHHVTIREKNTIGNNCSVGSYSDIQDRCKIGNYVRLHSGVFLGQLTEISDYAWLFPHVITTNDKYPPLDHLIGCKIGRYAIIAAGSLLLPGVKIGEDAMIAARSVVTKDVEDGHFVKGFPARDYGLAEELKDENNNSVYPWKKYLKEDRGYPWQKGKNV